MSYKQATCAMLSSVQTSFTNDEKLRNVSTLKGLDLHIESLTYGFDSVDLCHTMVLTVTI